MIKRTAYFCSCLLLLLVNLHAQKPLKHLYLGNDTHTDLIWNAGEEEWYKMNLDMAKFYLNLGESTRDNSPEARSKWNYDVAWTLYMLEKRAPRELFDRLIDQIKIGQASVPFNFTLPVYGASTLESALRSFYYAGQLERRYGLDIDLAICQENATIPLGLASLWAGSGAKYSWRGVCNCATKINTIGPREHEIYWYTGLDGSRILMKWYSSYGWNGELGGYAEMLEPTVAVIQMDTLCGSKRYPYNIAGAFGKGWDNMHNYSYDLTIGMGHRTLPGTKLYLSNQVDFFRHFESEYGNDLPAESVSYGNEWDLNLASLAEVSAQVKRSMEKLRTAEAMAAIVTEGKPGKPEPLAHLKEAFLYGLGMYNLHGWTADGPINRHDFASYMRRQQSNITVYVDSLLLYSCAEFGKKINNSGKEHVVYVFNALNWERDGLADIPLEGEFSGVLDLVSGKKTAGTVISRGDKKILRVQVEAVPSTGYKLLQLVKLDVKTANDPFEFSGDRLETPFYSVKLSPTGAILSLYDKKLKKEWAKSRLNELDKPAIEDGEEIAMIEKDAQHITLRCSSGVPVKHQCLLTFYSANPRIDIENTIQQNFEGLLHWSFDFNVDQPEIWHEELGAIIKAKLASAGGHYADKMARYDYLTLNHFVNVGNAKESISLSNGDCLFFNAGNSSPTFLDMNSATIHVLVGGQVNENLGVINQDGDSLFHQSFSLLPQAHAFDQGEAMRFALEHQNPFQAGVVTGDGEWTDRKWSFLTTDSKNTILWSLKPGEEGGSCLRFWNMESQAVNAKILFSSPLQKAMYASHVETLISEIPVNGNKLELGLNRQQLKTICVWRK